MRNKVLQTIAGAIFVMALIVGGAQLLVSGQDEAKNGVRIEGTWRLVITQRNCQNGAPLVTSQSLLAFAKGGTLTGIVGGRPNPGLQSGSFGVWRREGAFNEYSFALMLFRYNPDGTFAGTQRVRQTVQLRADGNEFTSSGNIEILDINDNVIATGCSTAVGTPFQ